MPAFNPLNIVSSVASNWFYQCIPSQVTLSGANATGLLDQSANAYNTVEGTAGNGGIYVPSAFGGLGAVRFDGVDDYQVNTGVAAQTTIGGTDKACLVMMAVRRITAGSSGDALLGCGCSASADPFFRIAEGSNGNSWTGSKRDAATSAGGDGNLDRLAFGALARNTVASFCNFDLGSAYSCAGIPTAAEESNLDLWFSQYNPTFSARLTPTARLTPNVRLSA